MSTDLDPASGYTFPGLQGTVVAVTGGASGIGLETARVAARSGASVIAGDLNAAACDAAQQEASADRLPIRFVPLNVADPDSVSSFVDLAAAETGMFTGLVCAAGIAPESPFLDLTLDQWNTVLDVNLTGPFLVNQAAARVMIDQGVGGSIVNVTAGNAVTGSVRRASYTASKAGLNSLTKTMARELGTYNIRVNNVAPGAVNTPLARTIVPFEESVRRAEQYPIPRVGEPSDLAHCIAFLLSDLSPWITGQTIHVSGGMIMQ